MWATLGCAAALLALRLPYLFHPAVWIDEAFSLFHARHSLPLLWGIGWRLESSPPLYYTAIWAWTHLFGGAEPVARSLSLLLTLLAAGCVYGAGTSLAGRRAGAVAAILFLCQPLMFVYSVEIRPYALQVLLIAGAIAALAGALADLGSGRIRSTTGAISKLAPIVAAAALATYTHSTTPVFLAALSGAAAIYGLAQRCSRVFWLAWFLTNCAALLAVTPQLLAMLEVIRTNERGIAWIPSPDLKWVLGVTRSLAIGEFSWNTVMTKLAGCTAVALVTWSAWRLRARRLTLAVGLVLPVLGLGGLWAASLLQPVLMPRTALWLVVPLCVLVGCGVSTLQWRGPRFGMLVALMVAVFAAMSIINMNNRNNDRPWPRFFAQMAADARPGDEVVAVDKEVLCVLDYYAAGEVQRSARRWQLERGPGQAYRSHQRIPLGCNEVAQLPVEQLPARLPHGAGLWLLAGDDLQREDIEAVLRGLGTSVTVTRRYEWRNKTLAWRVERQ